VLPCARRPGACPSASGLPRHPGTVSQAQSRPLRPPGARERALGCCTSCGGASYWQGSTSYGGASYDVGEQASTPSATSPPAGATGVTGRRLVVALGGVFSYAGASYGAGAAVGALIVGGGAAPVDAQPAGPLPPTEAQATARRGALPEDGRPNALGPTCWCVGLPARCAGAPLRGVASFAEERHADAWAAADRAGPTRSVSRSRNPTDARSVGAAPRARHPNAPTSKHAHRRPTLTGPTGEGGCAHPGMLRGSLERKLRSGKALATIPPEEAQATGRNRGRPAKSGTGR
jgi:hypothetical protein